MAKRKTNSLTESEARAIVQRALKESPIVSGQYAVDVEQVFLPDSTLSIARRLGTMMASQDADFWQRVATDRGAALLVAGQFEAIESAVATLREVAEVMAQGLCRARLVLAKHRDMEAILSESAAHAVVGPALKEAAHV